MSSEKSKPGPLDRVASWFKGDQKRKPRAKKAAAPEPETAPKAPAAAQTAIDSGAVVRELEAALSHLQKHGGQPIAGRVQALRFDELRRELGDKWARYQERMERVIESSITQYLSAGDSHWRLGECAYILVFSSVAPMEAEIKCGLIRAKIEEFLRGDARLAGKVTVETAVATVDGEIALQEIEDLETLYERLNLATASDQTAADGPAESDGAAGFAPIRHDKTWADWHAIVSDVTAARLRAQDMDVGQETIWDIGQRRIAGYTVAARDPKNAGPRTRLFEDMADEPLAVALDQASVLLGRRLLTDADAPAADLVFAQTQYWSHTNTRLRDDLIKLWRNCSAGQASALVMEIADIPSPRKFSSFNDVLAPVAGQLDKVAVCFDLHHPHIRLIRGKTVGWAGVAVPDALVDEAGAAEALARFAETAAPYATHLYVRGVRSETLLRAAADAGIGYVIRPGAA